MSSTNNGEYIGNCKFCKDHLSLDFIYCFKTSIENSFYFCRLGHYWTVKDISEQTQSQIQIQTTENSESNITNKNESYQDKPFNRDRDRPFNRDRDRPFNRDR